MSSLDSSQKEYFSQQIASLASDPTNRAAWDAALERLTASDVKGEAITEFINNQQAALNARYSDTYLKNMGVSDGLISQYTNASDEQLNQFHETFKKWKKDIHEVEGGVFPLTKWGGHKAHINHYFTKSWEEWKRKILDRGDAMPGHRKIDEFFLLNPDLNDIKDKLISEIIK